MTRAFSSKPGRRGAPWGLVGMIGLIVVIESFVARRAVDFTPWGTWAWRVSSKAASRRAPGCELLVFGDSLMKVGILPPVIEDRLGKRTYNLSVCGAPAPTSYFLLRRALEAGARPSAVLVDYLPNMLAGGPRDFSRHWPELLTAREWIELSLTARDATFFASAGLGMLFPSVRARHDIRAGITRALNGEGSHLRQSTLDYWHNWGANEGGQATAKNRLFQGDIDPVAQRKILSHVWWCARVNAEYVRRFLALAQAHQIHVYWLLPPLTSAVQSERDRTGSDLKHTGFVRSIQAEFLNVTVIDGRRARYGDTVFFDPIHLDREGASTLSADIADIIAHSSSDVAQDGRWVDLPVYRQRQTTVPLEEIVDFNVALQTRQGRLRR